MDEIIFLSLINILWNEFRFNIEKKLALIQWLTSLNDVSMIDKILELKNKESKRLVGQKTSDEEKRIYWKGD